MFRAMREAKARIQLGPVIEGNKLLLAHHGVHPTAADWDDPYLYGYFGGASHTLLKLNSSAKLDGESVAMVLDWGWTLLTGLPNGLYLSRFNAFVSINEPSWSDGYDKGLLWALMLSNAAKRDLPFVQEAICAGRLLAAQHHKAGGPAPTHASELQDAASVVIVRDWINYIAHKSAEAA